MKRVKIILAAVLVLVLAIMLVKDNGIVRNLTDGLTGSQALAQPEKSEPEAADKASASTEPAAEPAQAAEDNEGLDAADADDSSGTDDMGAGDLDAEDDSGEDVVGGPDDPNQPDSGQTPLAVRSDIAAGGDPNRPGLPFDRDRMRDMAARGGEGRRREGRPSDASSVQAQAAPEDPMEAINLNNVEMKKIVQMLGEWTGKPIIPTSDEIMNTKITIYATQKVPRSQAMALILAALKAKGVIVEQSPDKILFKPIATAKLGSVPTLAADEPLARITDKSQMVEKFFRLQNYSPTKLMTIITPLIAEYGHVTSMEDTKQLAVIDSVENLLRVERIIRQLDVPESEQMVEEIFIVENGDPIEVVQVLQLILDTERRSRAARQVAPSSSSSSGGSQARPAMSVVVAQGEVPVRLIPIPKHNWIIARASAADMEQIRNWIKKLDRVESVPSEQTIVQVRHVDAREVANIIENTLRNTPGVEFRTSVVVQPLVQAKQIVIFGSEENRKMVEKLIAEIDLPLDDLFVEKTFKLQFADPDQIKVNIEGLYGDPAMSGRSGSYGYNPYSYNTRNTRPGSMEDSIVKVIAYPTQQQVTVIATEKNMVKIERQILDEWDVPIDIEKDQYRILSLHNSDPVQMSNLLTKLFSESGSDGSRDLMRMIFGGRATDTQKKIVGSLYGMLTFEPVPDTKKIIVISKIPEAYTVIEKLVNELDSEEKAEVPRVITLNYADAEDLCDQLNAILNESGTLATVNRSTRGLSAYQAGGESDSATARAGGGGGGAAASGGTITPWWTRQRTTADQGRPTSNLIGRVRFIPVARSKAVLVLSPPEYITDIELMIAELDRPGMQVMIKVVIVEVDHASMTSLGVQLSSSRTLFSNIGSDAMLALTELTTGFSRGSFTLAAGLDVDVLIDVLAKTVNAKVLNQPTLWTKDNQEAIFVKGQRVAFIQQRITDRQTTGSTTETFSYDDVGLTLRVRPNITPEKAVDMSVNLIVSQVGESVNNQLATNQLDTTTHVIVNDGQTILMGGILFQNDNVVVNKVPLLGDVPLLGGLFRHTNNTLRNNELLAFVTPYVMDANSLTAIPVDLDESRQLREPYRKMDQIRNDLDGAMDWMSEAVIKEMDNAKPHNKASSREEVRIKSRDASEPGASRVPATDGATNMYPAPAAAEPLRSAK
ncbi:MAG: hypothetical protein IH624_10305 [Phycisphaerae bacterium]|nr:hypothetical protein [Phycisphaerae bacterium]